MGVDVTQFVNNIALILMWVGAWSLTDLFIYKYLKKYKVISYFFLFVIGSVMVLLDNYYL